MAARTQPSEPDRADQGRGIAEPSASFTTGPWVAIPTAHRRKGSAPIFPDGLWIVQRVDDAERGERVPVAVVDHADDHDAPTRAGAAADARLIAAAPDMHAALKVAEDVLWTAGLAGSDAAHAAHTEVCRALAEATGSEPAEPQSGNARQLGTPKAYRDEQK